MNVHDHDSLATRVLLLARAAMDVEQTGAILARAAIACVHCRDLVQVCEQLSAGAGALLIEEEALPVGDGRLAEWLGRQPPWSDLPVLVVARAEANSTAVVRAMEELGNVTILERPVRAATLLSAVRSAQRARKRQYQLREQLVQRERAAEPLGMAMAAANAGSWQLNLETGEFNASDRAVELHITERKRTEAALHYSEQLHRLAFEQSPTGMAYVGLDERFIEVNPVMCEITGYAAKELVGLKASDLTHPDDRSRDAELLAPFVRGDTPTYQNEKRCVRKDGSVRWVAVSARMVTDAEGRPLHSVDIVRDITFDRTAQRMVREAQDQFITLANAAPAMLWVTQADARLQFISRGWLDYTGQSEAQAFGDDGFGWLKAVHPEDGEQLGKAFLDANQKQESFSLDYRIRRADGAYRWAIDAGRPRVDANGQFLGYVGSVIDVHDRQLADVRLRQSEARLRRVFESNVTGMIRWDLDSGLILDANAEFLRMTGYAPEDLSNRTLNFRDLTPPDWADRNEAKIQSLRTIGHAAPYEKEYFRKDGSRVPFIIAGTRFEDSPSEGMSILVDITERKLIEEALRASEYRLRLTLEAAATGIWEWDVAHDIVTWSPECYLIHGIVAGEFDGTAAAFDRLMHPDDRNRVWAGVRAAMARRETYACEFRIVRPDGEIRWVANTGRELYSPGSTGKMVGTITDITERKLAEVERQKAVVQYRSVVEGNPALICRFHSDGTLAYVNDTYCRVFSRSRESLIGKTFMPLIPDADRAAVERMLERMAPGMLPHALEHRVVLADGQIRWHRWTNKLVSNDAGDSSELLAIGLDITEQKQAESELRDGEQRMRLATEATGVGVWQWNYVTGDIQWDAQMFAIYGIAPNPDNCVRYDTWRAAVLPEDLPHQEEVLQDTIRRRGRGRREFRIHRAGDGDCRVVEAVEIVRTGADGQVEWVLGTNLDITDRKRAEAALRDSEARLSGILRRSPAGIVQTDAAGCMTLVNPRWCEMLGRPEADLLGRSILEITHASSVAETTTAFARLAAGGPDFQIEKAYSRKDGSVLRAQSNIAALRSPQGVFLGLIAVVLDISERLRSEGELRRLAAELSEADRRKDVFLATLAHELRNPLAPIRNGLQVMKLASNTGKAHEQARDMMDRQLSQLVRLVDDLLDVSRITQGKVELRKERISLQDVIEAAVETSRPAIDEAGHELAVVLPDEQIFVDGDATRLVQVVSNLLHNSAKYTHRGGHVRLAAERQDNTAVVSVKDDGIGIPPNMIGRVFEMFTQVDRSLEKTTGGLGIGLSLVKGLLAMHGGSIEAKSGGEGLGSEFVVRLPLVMSVAGQEGADGQPVEVGPAALLRILVVDDNVDAADSLGQLLELLGNEVRTANDGDAAIAVAAQFRPDVVLMDIGMPKLNGYGAARRIRQQPWGQDMVLVALTGWGQADDRRRSADAGFDAHLVKPVEMDALTALMSGLKRADGDHRNAFG